MFSAQGELFFIFFPFFVVEMVITCVLRVSGKDIYYWKKEKRTIRVSVKVDKQEKDAWRTDATWKKTYVSTVAEVLSQVLDNNAAITGLDVLVIVSDQDALNSLGADDTGGTLHEEKENIC